MESNGVVCNDLWNIQEVPPEHMGSIPVLTANYRLTDIISLSGYNLTALIAMRIKDVKP